VKIFKTGAIIPQIPRLLLRRRFRFDFEMLPFEARDLSPKKISNFFVAGMNQFLLPSRPFGHPVIAQVEPSNTCNLACPMCLTTSETGARPAALLPLDLFRKFIDETGDYLLLLILWGWGEPFLNPDLFRMIEYAKSKNILVHSSTNGNLPLIGDRADELVASGLDSLVFGVDGATEETYSRYRRGGSLALVQKNIRAVVEARARKGSSVPRLNLRFVVMKHNEHEIPAAKQMAMDLGVDTFSLKTADFPPDLAGACDELFVPDNDRYRRYETEARAPERRKASFVCMRPWKRVTLDALGHVIACESDYASAYSFGAAGAGESVENLWKGSAAQEFRRRFNKGHNDFSMCRDCTTRSLKSSDCVVERSDLPHEQGS
jgi:radical SAM protein with 4Fe4S-binding SPASM domain